MNLKFWKNKEQKQEIKQKTNYEFVEYYYDYRISFSLDSVIDIYCVYKDSVSGEMISKRIKTVEDTVEMKIELNKLKIRWSLNSKYNRYLQQLSESKLNNTIKELKEAMEENKVYKEE